MWNFTHKKMTINTGGRCAARYGGKNENTFNAVKMRFIYPKCVFRPCKLLCPCFCYLLFYWTFERW